MGWKDKGIIRQVGIVTTDTYGQTYATGWIIDAAQVGIDIMHKTLGGYTVDELRAISAQHYGLLGDNHTKGEG